MKDIMLYPSNNCDYDSIISGHFDNMVNIGVSQKKIKKNTPNREELRNKLKSEMIYAIIPLKPFSLDKFISSSKSSRRTYFMHDNALYRVVTMPPNNNTTIGDIESVINPDELPPQLENANYDNEDNLSMSGESNSLEQSEYNSEDIEDELPPLEEEDVGDELPPLPESNEEYANTSILNHNLDDNDSIADVDGQWEDNVEWGTSNSQWEDNYELATSTGQWNYVTYDNNDDIPELVNPNNDHHYNNDDYNDMYDVPMRWKDLLVSYIGMNKPIAENIIKN